MKGSLSKIFVAAVVAAVVLGGDLAAVYANGGAPHRVVDGDAEFLLPVKHSSVEIRSERLAYDLSDFEGETMTADVSATYEMFNASDASVDVVVAFVTNNAACPLDVRFKGETAEVSDMETLDWKNYPIETRYVNTPIQRGWNNYDSWKDFGVWEPTFQEIMFYFSTGGISADFDPSGNYVLNVSLFTITFGPREACELVVSYSEKAAFISDNFNYSGGSGHNPRFQFYYLLEPAQYWKDFGNLSISVSLSRSLKTEFSLEGFTLDKASNVYSASFEGLPSRNLEIVVYENSKVDKPNPWPMLLLIIGGVVFIIAGLLALGLIVGLIGMGMLKGIIKLMGKIGIKSLFL